ncbi:MAG: DinB family protein [Flavobacteriaceae bacterium]
MLINSIKNTLSELSGLLNQLSNEEYCFPFPQLSNSTVGQHVRHIIELFQCLENQYENEQINYDIRKRDNNIETNVEVALNAIETIINSIEKPNKNLILQQEVDGDVLFIETNYRRELLYNLEHCIHHQALIKVALLQMSHLKFNDNFGVARSTIEYRKKCAQ